MKADRVMPVGIGAGRAGAEVRAPAFVVTTRWLREVAPGFWTRSVGRGAAVRGGKGSR